MKSLHASIACLVAIACLSSARLAAGQETHRLYDAITAFVNNDEGRDFNVTLEVRDLNHVARGPAELLLKVYDPQGRPVVREVLPDDGVVANTSPPLAGWDHEAWYYATCYRAAWSRWCAGAPFRIPSAWPAWRSASSRATSRGGKRGSTGCCSSDRPTTMSR